MRLGNDALVMRFPTDLFSTGYNLLVQGVERGRRRRADRSYLAFGGASSSSLAAPSFQATRIEKPMGALFLQRRISPTVRLTGNVLDRPPADGHARRAVAGHAGSDDGPGGRHRRRQLLRGGSRDLPARAASASRRCTPGTPTGSAGRTCRARRRRRSERRERRGDLRGRARRSRSAPPGSTSCRTRPTERRPFGPRGNSAFASGRVSDVRITGGLYDSRSQGIRNLSSYLAVGREITRLARRRAVPAAEPAVGPHVEHDADRQPAVAGVAPGAADAAALGPRPPADHPVRRQPDHGARASSARTTRSSISRSSRSSPSGARST